MNEKIEQIKTKLCPGCQQVWGSCGCHGDKVKDMIDELKSEVNPADNLGPLFLRIATLLAHIEKLEKEIAQWVPLDIHPKCDTI